MYLDENVLKILYKLPLEEDITEQVADYLLSCAQSASEAIEVMKANSAEMDSDFTELTTDLETAINKEEPEVTEIMDAVDALEDSNESFKELYEGYVKEINLELVKKGLERNPDTVEDLKTYLETISDSLAIDYVKVFVDTFEEDEEKPEKD